MNETSANATNARGRLLASAGRLFAEHGLEGVTVREIAADAGVGHAGVNYHFRSKAELYREVLRMHGPKPDHGTAVLPDDGSVQAARGLLESWVRGFVREATRAPDAIKLGLIRHEMTRPNGPGDEVFHAVIRPHHARLESLIERLRPDLDETDRRIAAISIISQGLIYRLTRSVSLRNLGVEEIDEVVYERIADRVLTNALLGLGLEPPSNSPSPTDSDVTK